MRDEWQRNSNRKMHMKRLYVFGVLLCGAIAQTVPTRAATVTFANSNPTTDTYVDWQITGLYSELLSGASYVAGPWTLSLDSPVPAPLPGSGDPWSLRVVLERSGLTGNRTDYAGGAPGILILTQDANNLSGGFAAHWAGASFNVDISSEVTWIAGGSMGLKSDTPPPPTQGVPEPSMGLASALVFLGLVGVPGARALRRHTKI